MNSFADSSFKDILDDLSSRFIINVPEEELASVERICFQIEQAHWFYEDFIRDHNPSLPSFGLKTFSAKIFQHCPLLHRWQHDKAFDDFIKYKVRVPVCGAIILNDKLDKCLLVKGWSAKSGWGFPKGKINKDESQYNCAAREVLEETGFDISSRMTETDYIEVTTKEQSVRLYIVPGVGEDTNFECQTRKEISKIDWHILLDLPGYKAGSANALAGTTRNKYYMIIPFMHKLRSWVQQRKKMTKDKQKLTSSQLDPDLSNGATPSPSFALKSLLGLQSQSQPETAGHSILRNVVGTKPVNGDLSSERSLKQLLGLNPAMDTNLRMTGKELNGLLPNPSSSASNKAEQKARAPHEMEGDSNKRRTDSVPSTQYALSNGHTNGSPSHFELSSSTPISSHLPHTFHAPTLSSEMALGATTSTSVQYSNPVLQHVSPSTSDPPWSSTSDRINGFPPPLIPFRNDLPPSPFLSSTSSILHSSSHHKISLLGLLKQPHPSTTSSTSSFLEHPSSTSHPNSLLPASAPVTEGPIHTLHFHKRSLLDVLTIGTSIRTSTEVSMTKTFVNEDSQFVEKENGDGRISTNPANDNRIGTDGDVPASTDLLSRRNPMKDFRFFVPSLMNSLAI